MSGRFPLLQRGGRAAHAMRLVNAGSELVMLRTCCSYYCVGTALLSCCLVSLFFLFLCISPSFVLSLAECLAELSTALSRSPPLLPALLATPLNTTTRALSSFNTLSTLKDSTRTRDASEPVLSDFQLSVDSATLQAFAEDTIRENELNSDQAQVLLSVLEWFVCMGEQKQDRMVTEGGGEPNASVLPTVEGAKGSSPIRLVHGAFSPVAFVLLVPHLPTIPEYPSCCIAAFGSIRVVGHPCAVAHVCVLTIVSH